MAIPTSLRPLALAAAAIIAILPVTGCDTTAQPTQPPVATSSPSPATFAPPTASPSPATSAPPRIPRSVTMTTGVPATIACEVPPDRTLRLTELAGTMTYGYESELTPYSENDEGFPADAPHYLASCDLTTGVVMRLESPGGYPSVDGMGVVSHVSIVDLDRGRMLLHGDRPGIRRTPVSYLLDPVSGGLAPLQAFTDHAVRPTAIDDEWVLGELTLETLDEQSVPAVLHLGSGEFRLLTSDDIGSPGTWIRPVDVENGIVVGDVLNANSTESGPVWAYLLDTGQSLDVPTALRARFARVTGFDGNVIVGYAYRDRTGGTPQPFAWSIREPDIAWLPLPADRSGGYAWDVQRGLVIGRTYGSVDGEFHVEGRGIVWDLASGAYLDLGTGPRELSGTLATDTSLAPESLVAALDGDRVLGFLGEGCIATDTPYCRAANFGGSPIIWDIGEWLASLDP